MKDQEKIIYTLCDIKHPLLKGVKRIRSSLCWIAELPQYRKLIYDIVVFYSSQNRGALLTDGGYRVEAAYYDHFRTRAF